MSARLVSSERNKGKESLAQAQQRAENNSDKNAINSGLESSRSPAGGVKAERG